MILWNCWHYRQLRTWIHDNHWDLTINSDSIRNSWIASSCVKEAPWFSHVPPMVLWWSSRPLMVSPNMSKTRSRHNPWWGLLHSDWRKRPSKHEPHKLYYLRVSDGLVRFGTAITAFRFDYFLGRNIKDAYIQTDIQSSNKEGKYIWMNSAQHETLLSEFNFLLFISVSEMGKFVIIWQESSQLVVTWPSV